MASFLMNILWCLLLPVLLKQSLFTGCGRLGRQGGGCRLGGWPAGVAVGGGWCVCFGQAQGNHDLAPAMLQGFPQVEPDQQVFVSFTAAVRTGDSQPEPIILLLSAVKLGRHKISLLL